MPFLPSNLWLMAGSYIFCIVHRGSMVGRLVLTTNWLASHRTSGRMCVELVSRTIADHTLVNVTFYKDICHTHQRSNMSQNICLCMFIFPFFSFVPLSQSSWWSLGCNIPNQNKWFVVNNFQKYCHKICKEIVIVPKGSLWHTSASERAIVCYFLLWLTLPYFNVTITKHGRSSSHTGSEAGSWWSAAHRAQNVRLAQWSAHMWAVSRSAHICTE